MNLNVSMTSCVMSLRIAFGHLPCMFIASFSLVWQVSLTILVGCVNCLSLIHLSIAHGWSWVHEWKGRSIHTVGGVVVFLHVSTVIGTDFYRVCFKNFIMIFFNYNFQKVLSNNEDVDLKDGSLSSFLVGSKSISPSGILVYKIHSARANL